MPEGSHIVVNLGDEHGVAHVVFAYKGETVAEAILEATDHHYSGVDRPGETWWQLEFTAGPISGEGEGWLLQEKERQEVT